MTCDARIRPFRPVNNVEIVCNLDPHPTGRPHAGCSSATVPEHPIIVEWFDDDRRTYHGPWHECGRTFLCTLPANHPGGCTR